MKNSRTIIAEMPKVELHLHLEGAFTFEYLLSLVEKYGGDPNIKNIQDLKNLFIFRDFPHFIKTWYWKNQFFREPLDFEESTYQSLKKLAEQNVVYAEVFYSPWDFEKNGLRTEEITEATISGIRRAESDFNIKTGLIADIVRNYGAERSIKRMEEVLPYLNNGIIGLGLGGNEIDFPAKDFKEVYRKAKSLGFRLTAHAGEAAGPKSVREAVDELKVERIGHGVRSIEDPVLIDMLRTKQIPLEVCITSNICTKIYSSFEDHPFKKLFDEGLFLTVNSDDPPMFGSDITGEFQIIHEKFGFSLSLIKELTINSVNASFLDRENKEKYKSFIDDYWDKLN
ncbi:MAG: adenosine deaminase [Ignavibacteriae bacterium HGW-Ignavibacteriae-2]|jgi:adenosine deaminase|nr:MAG: adenosine deaminase [Ignavibacteriae bacterium HGW-Ignavibacteriae-2]